MDEEPHSRDVFRWGIAALACTGLAVFSANIAGFIPAGFLNGLHASRVDGTNLNQLRTLVADMRQANNEISSQYRALLIRLNLLDDDNGAAIRRLAAVEKSLPLLIESLPLSTDIDRSLLTASITAVAGEVYDVEGGSMVVRYSPLFDGIAETELPDQPLPPVIEPMASTVAPQAIAVLGSYDAIIASAGALLLGTSPLMDEDQSGGERVVFGPLPDTASALMLCDRLERLDLVCEPAAYEGLAIP